MKKDESEIIYNPELETEFRYPIGRYIQDNKERINSMINSFMSIEEFKDKHVNIICRGSSGAIIATMFSLRLPDCRIVHIKKEGESSHDSSLYLGDGLSINLIVDDLISSGATIRAIHNKLNDVRRGINIDCLCISGYYGAGLGFHPTYVICGRDKNS